MSLINTEIKPFKATAFHNGKFVDLTEADVAGRADDGGAASAPGSADARPQVGLDVAVGVGSVTEVGLAGDPDR